MADTRSHLDKIPGGVLARQADRSPKLTKAEMARLATACQELGITREEFVYHATRQALDEHEGRAALAAERRAQQASTDW